LAGPLAVGHQPVPDAGGDVAFLSEVLDPAAHVLAVAHAPSAAVDADYRREWAFPFAWKGDVHLQFLAIDLAVDDVGVELDLRRLLIGEAR
jgi:hypothetical protein